MKVINTVAEMVAWSSAMALTGRTIALVPTMGYFHEGHLSLMRHACQLADFVVVSLFVNPMQFGPSEDLVKYPSDFERDVSMASGVGVNVLFAPTASDMYPQGFQTRISVDRLSEGLCGRSRPGHFTGVTTVVVKLLHIVRPQIAVFGRKDFQQLSVINRMVADLNMDIKIISHPIVRESDGLAMSSRNIYLSAKDRSSALCLYKAINHARQVVRQGVIDANTIVSQLHDLLLSDPAVQIDYVNIVDRFSLNVQTDIDRDSVLLLAIRIGRTRLIDNDILFEGEVT